MAERYVEISVPLEPQRLVTFMRYKLNALTIHYCRGNQLGRERTGTLPPCAEAKKTKLPALYICDCLSRLA